MAQRRRSYDPAGDGWHLDRRVPVGLLVAGLVQFAMFVFAWAELTADVRNVKEAVLSLTEELKESRGKLEVLPTYDVRITFNRDQHRQLEELVAELLRTAYKERSRVNGSSNSEARTR